MRRNVPCSSPERFHHPRENKCLFKALRRVCPVAETTLAELEKEHHKGPEDIARLRAALAEIVALAPAPWGIGA